MSALAATRPSLVDVRFQVREQRVELLVGPAAADGRHVAGHRRDSVLSFEQQRAETLRLGEERAVRDVGPVAALARQAMALRAHAFPLAAPECLRRRPAGPRRVLLLRLDDHRRTHLRMEDAAELAAAPAVRAGAVGLEPGVRALAGDRVELPAELGDPPAVVD